MQLRERLAEAQASVKVDLTGRSVKPIEFVGSQRTAYTHRKNQKRVKQVQDSLLKKQEEAAASTDREGKGTGK